MRPVICFSSLAAALLVAPLALAEPCAKPAEATAFDIASLKTRLMVTALKCDVRERYNDFVLRFRGDLVANERNLHAWFNRAFGGRGQQRHDDYITQLANAHSQNGIREGTAYCANNVGQFSEILSLRGGEALAGYAATHGMAQPIAVQSCPAAKPATQVAQAAAHRP